MADELKFAGKNTLLYLWQKIKATFVSKETGKGLSTNDYTTAEKEKLAGIAAGAQVNQDISGKADKVSNATNGNFASLDANGNLIDSGHSHNDYLTDHQDISGKADKTDTVLETTLSRGRLSGSTVGAASYAFGVDVTASGQNSHAEGYGTTASNPNAHAEGGSTTASGVNSHAEGAGTTAGGQNSHAEGGVTTASGQNSHAEGGNSIASGANSHAEGGGTTASGVSSHAEGGSTIANCTYQHVFGLYNAYESGSSASDGRGVFVEIVGNGSNDSSRSNSRTLDWNGNERLSGMLYVNANPNGTGGTPVLTAHQDISGKANLASPAFTGNPTAPTPTAGSNNTAIATTEFVNGAVASALGNITGIRFEIIQDLSGDGETGVIYLLEAANGNITGNAGNYFDEYIWLEDDSRYEKIGTTDVDLSGYVASSDISEISNAEVDTLIATASS